MGASASPAYFQRCMDLILKKYKYSSVLAYLDDVLIYSPSYDKHLEHLKEVFECFRTARLRMNGKKCHFAMQQLVFLGHKFTKDGCEVDKSKIELMTKWPRPTSQTELRRF